MEEKEYLEQFGLSPKEMKLHILQCGSELPKKHSANIESVKPRELAELPFDDQSFDLALCSHVLFLDNQQANEKTHEQGEASHKQVSQASQASQASLVSQVSKTSKNDFDLKALMELARVAGEVRVFPLVDDEGKPASSLGPLIQALQQKGFGVELKQTGGAQAKKGTALLRLWNESCLLS